MKAKSTDILLKLNIAIMYSFKKDMKDESLSLTEREKAKKQFILYYRELARSINFINYKTAD